MLWGLVLASPVVQADCVYGAQSKTFYTRLDDHTLVLRGGVVGQDIVLRTYAFVLPYSQVTVLKDQFCSYELGVLNVDGQVWDVNQVNWFWR